MTQHTSCTRHHESPDHARCHLPTLGRALSWTWPQGQLGSVDELVPECKRQSARQSGPASQPTRRIRRPRWGELIVR
eukprot:6066824-Prymnesium_polylepis.1